MLKTPDLIHLAPHIREATMLLARGLLRIMRQDGTDVSLAKARELAEISLQPVAERSGHAAMPMTGHC